MFKRRVSFDCYEPETVPPQRTDFSVQVIPNTPFQPAHRSAQPLSPVLRPGDCDQAADQGPQPGAGRRAYHQMTDEELLRLDNQFGKTRAPDIDTFRTSAVTCAPSPTSLTTFKSVKGPQYNIKSYPTKNPIARSSFTLCFSNAQPSDLDAGKPYLILLGDSPSSICAVEYYKKSLAKSGDTIVVACSFSSVSFGEQSPEELKSFTHNFTKFVLENLDIEQSIKVVFEFFKTPSFLQDVMNLYVPQAVIVGTNRKFSRSTSFESGQRKFVSLVYAGLEEFYRNVPHGGNELKPSYSLNQSPSSPTEELAAVDLDPKASSSTGIQIKIDESAPTLNISNMFDKATIALFRHLNVVADPKPGLRADRRGSMHSFSSSLSGGNMSGSAVFSDDEDVEDEDNGDERDDYDMNYNYSNRLDSDRKRHSSSSNINNTPVMQAYGLSKGSSSLGGGEIRKWKSGSSSTGSNSISGVLSKEERDRLALFEQHQKAISNVNTKSVPRSAAKSKASTPGTTTTTTSSSSSGGGFFKKLLGRK